MSSKTRKMSAFIETINPGLFICGAAITLFICATIKGCHSRNHEIAIKEIELERLQLEKDIQELLIKEETEKAKLRGPRVK